MQVVSVALSARLPLSSGAGVKLWRLQSAIYSPRLPRRSRQACIRWYVPPITSENEDVLGTRLFPLRTEATGISSLTGWQLVCVRDTGSQSLRGVRFNI